jgi:hypothetical protein
MEFTPLPCMDDLPGEEPEIRQLRRLLKRLLREYRFRCLSVQEVSDSHEVRRRNLRVVGGERRTG